ncbi:TPA: hypothetical protein DEO28_04020 [Candidatus Dependentiae bacterium]|nr:MAG: hypothetical protein UR14_C0006G0041 [candidate division TM6 bacterium GW2011_GWE2_31_21]KKP53536.1 MAG: hypothetical protein UR43_C0004G0077 [candidate division TM6 bacterium GW2011_GWF2_33_332]HBS48223.1 hypothetical protein [Candidatus Dependentiae bacterium]HBZ73649.1 hypothetical protein [Candidatus Dependentiae bacterium]
MKKLFRILFFTLLTIANLKAADLPVFYRAQHFQGNFPKNATEWATSPQIRYSTGNSRKGYDASCHTTNVLNIYGLINVNKLAYNMENLTSKPITNQWLNQNTGTIPNYFFGGDNGKIELNGKLKVDEFEFDIQQYLTSGFFARFYMPLRHVKINQISYTDKTSTTTAHYTDFESFLTNNFNTVLNENGLHNLTSPYNKTSAGDLNLSLGWQGKAKMHEYIQEISGYAELGVTIPTASKTPLDQVVYVANSYDGFYSVNARGVFEITVCNWLNGGLYGNFLTFFNQSRTIRMATDKTQSGLVILEKGHTQLNAGNIWNLAAYLKLNPFFKQVLINVGYSFTRQEPTHLDVRDSTFLSTYIAAQQADASVIYKETKDDVVNSNVRLKDWSQHVLHFQIGYDATAINNYKYSPTIYLSYDCPIYGKRSYKTDMLGGNIGLTIKWNF